MILPSHQTHAFHAVAQTGNFTTAARQLRLTQSALSQRIANLEEALGVRLFVRGRKGASLTEAGERLLRHCDATHALEAELLDEMTNGGTGLGGPIRVAGFSSVMRSLVLPALALVFRSHPRTRAEIYVRELAELPALLRTAQADFVLLDQRLEMPGLESIFLGNETLVLVDSRHHPAPEHTFLDHDPEDRTTLVYLRKNGLSSRGIKRHYLEDIYGVLDGVAQGLGRAVVPRHLLGPPFDRTLRIVEGAASMPSPVYLHHAKQPSRPRLFDVVHEAIVRDVSSSLSRRTKPRG